MMSNGMIISIFLPIAAGLLLLLASFLNDLRGRGGAQETDLRQVHLVTGLCLAVTAVLALLAAWKGGEVTLFYLMKGIPVFFRVDELSSLFVTIVSVGWVAAGVYAFVYMKQEGREKQFFGFYLIVYGVLLALGFAGNLVTLYLFYELMTLTSMPLVLHNGSREAVMAALKYLFYSMCGAYCGLFGIYFLNRYASTLTFVPGGSVSAASAQAGGGLLLAAVFVLLLGFGVKAGMFPMHAWLPAAHPVAPSPASAVLSSVIVKAGVLAIIRTVYYVAGAKLIRGTWVQTAWMALTLLTVFMGSMLAYREPQFKKRLAYSSISQLSYILFGLSVLTPTGMQGALLHMVFHALIKCGLFLVAGVFLFELKKKRVEEFVGVGRRMPVLLWSYTLLALALVGIPPASGFISKWYLAQGALEAGVGVFGYLGPAVLLVSALLTAGYLLPITIKGFFPGPDAPQEVLEYEKKEPAPLMLIPIVVLAVLAVGLGLWPNPLIRFAGGIAGACM